MCFFYFIEQHDRIRPRADGFRQLSALGVALVSRRRADEARYGVLLHILGHVEPEQCFLRAETLLRQRARKFRLSGPRRAEQQKRAHRAAAVREAERRAPECRGDRLYSVRLADDAACERRFQCGEGRQAVGRDLFFRHAALQRARRRHIVAGHALSSRQAHRRTRLVQKVDGLVRQAAVGQIPRGERHGSVKRGGLNRDLMVCGIPRDKPLQNGACLRSCGFFHRNACKPARQRAVFFDAPPIFLPRRRPDDLHATAREQRLEYIARVDAALGGPGSHKRMHLIHEQDRVSPACGFRQHRAEPLLEIAPVLRARDE